MYLDAIKNREQKISKVKDSNYQKILAEASSRWILYRPSKTECESAGVDSSWNKRAFQGLNLYIVDAVAVTSANKILAKDYQHDIAETAEIARNESLSTMAMKMEASVAQEAAEKNETDVICIDGSIVARLNKINPEVASDMAKRYGESIFVAKNSESRLQFDAKAGDIYYYNHASKSMPGFSIPVEIKKPYGSVFEIYARLQEHTPMVRIEVVGDASEPEVKRLLDKLCYRSVSGYPYCLKLAHNACKISNEDIDRIVSILSMQHEPGSRDALNE